MKKLWWIWWTVLGYIPACMWILTLEDSDARDAWLFLVQVIWMLVLAIGLLFKLLTVSETHGESEP